MLDVLVFGPHPDDAELGAGGAIVEAVAEGLKVGIIDLTAGEMGTLGTKEIRLKEAESAAKILGVEFRENLGLPDGFIGLDISQEDIFAVAKKIRQYQPKVVLAPYWDDRHPDHVASSEIITKAAHYAKLKKFNLEHPQHKIQQLIYYELNGQFTPSFIMDISDFFEQKKKAIMSHKSQFKEFSKEYLPFPLVERCVYYGSLINASYGEAFMIRNSLKIDKWGVIFNK